MKHHGCHGNTNTVPIWSYIDSLRLLNFIGNDYTALSYCRWNRSVDKILHQFIPLKLINSYKFKFLFTSCAFPIGQSVLKRNLIGSCRSNRKLINFLSNELMNLRKGIGAIFYQHFYCIDSKCIQYKFGRKRRLPEILKILENCREPP
jgi:hypothetical protein